MPSLKRQSFPIIVKIIFGLVLLGVTQLGHAQKKSRPIVAAASSLSFVLPKISSEFSRKSGKQVRLSFSSSGNIYRQIIQGAPYQLFLSADEKFIDLLVARSLAVDRGTVYAEGSIVLYTGRSSSVKADVNMRDLKKAVHDGRLQRFSIANSVHAPYGRAARDALKNAGLWKIIEGKSVIGENVAQAARFTTIGAVQAGIISYSLLIAIPSAKRGSFALIPKGWYSPIKQKMVLLNGAGKIAQAFYDFMLKEEAQLLLTKYGFSSVDKL